MSKGSMVEGKAAAVTGAGRGIGRAIAMGMAREDARVVVNDTRADRAHSERVQPGSNMSIAFSAPTVAARRA